MTGPTDRRAEELRVMLKRFSLFNFIWEEAAVLNRSTKRVNLFASPENIADDVRS